MPKPNLSRIVIQQNQIPSFEEILEDEDVNKLIFPKDKTVYNFDIDQMKEDKVIGSSMHVVKKYQHLLTGKVTKNSLNDF